MDGKTEQINVLKYNRVNDWQPLGYIPFDVDPSQTKPAIAINRSGQVYIAFEEANTLKLKVMTYNNQRMNWQSMDIGSIPSDHYNLSMALDSQDVPYFAYIYGIGSPQSAVYKLSFIHI